MKNLNLNTILLVGIAVLLTLQLTTCVKGRGTDSRYYEEKVKDLKEERVAVAAERDAIRSKYDSVLVLLTQKDGKLVERYKETQIKYEKIPVYINALPADSLVRAAIEY